MIELIKHFEVHHFLKFHNNNFEKVFFIIVVLPDIIGPPIIIELENFVITKTPIGDFYHIWCT
jgi:hypothetical protein